LQTLNQRADRWSRAFSIQRLKGSLFGNWPLWILDTVCAARRAVRRGRGADVRLIADAAEDIVVVVNGGTAIPDYRADAPTVHATGLVIGSR
jgi:hypothetical protein